MSYNLDAAEYFEFEIFGGRYKIRHITTEQAEILAKIENENADPKEANKKLTEFVLSLIESVDGSEPFDSVLKRMTSAHVKKFREMIDTEWGLDGNNQSPKGT